jgi:hypothetical protein
MTFIKKNTNNLTVSLIFEKENKEMVDIDYIFKKTNDNFCVYLNNLSLPINFDFRNRDNKKIYMNEFIKTFTHYVKFRENKEKLYFYSNILTKDDFRNKLVLKLKTLFGITILEDYKSLENISTLMEIGCCDTVTKIINFLNQERKVKSFKQIKKYLEKNGFVYLNDVYFNDFSNKLRLFT